MKTYLHYPLPDAFLPYNYCALPSLVPKLFRPMVESLLAGACGR